MKTLFVCWLLSFGANATALAQSAGTFTPTGNMTTPRSGHTATLLPDGKVLIFGGNVSDSDDTPATAELYDPATRTFTVTTMIGGGIPLPDGRMLFFTSRHSAETYDPLTGSFAHAGEMVADLYSAGAITLLRDGRVFVAGYPTAQIYDPITGTFAPTQPYGAAAPSILPNATLLTDGRVLLTGAVNICYEAQCREPGMPWTELYDPVTGMFSAAGRMNWWNNIYTATLLLNGKVLFVGGDNYNGIPSSAEVFDPSDGTFTAIESPPVSLQYNTVTLLPDAMVLITGGLGPDGIGQVTSELYVPDNGRFSAAGNMITARWRHTATLLRDGTVLIAGGSDSGGGATANAEIYRPAVLSAAPFIYTRALDDEGQGDIWRADTGQIASPEHPAVAGDILSMYVTGLSHGGLIPPQVAIGGRSAELLYFGSAPAYPVLSQVNIRVPGGIVPGPAVPVRLTYLGRPSNQVTIAVAKP
jgi:hypothetical protein